MLLLYEYSCLNYGLWQMTVTGVKRSVTQLGRLPEPKQGWQARLWKG